MHSLLPLPYWNSYGLIPVPHWIGIGKFTVIDDAIIAEADLGVNFFVDTEGLGQPRAEYVCKYLSELNPDVQGSYINDVSLLISKDY